nr:hypothetical protein MarFTME_268 [Marseillevirus futianmevirus]
MSRNSQIFQGLQVQKSLILPFTPLPRDITTGNIFMQQNTGDLYVRDSNAQMRIGRFDVRNNFEREILELHIFGSERRRKMSFWSIVLNNEKYIYICRKYI